jgi:uncharacterized protein YndB with AHSA1/START domain
MPANNKILYIVRTIRLPREQVFQAWTNPKEFKKWFGPEEGYSVPSAEFDFKTGGPYRFSMKSQHGEPYSVSGKFREINPPKWLVFTWNWENEKTWSTEPQKTKPPESVVIVQLKDRSDGKETELFFWHNGLRDDKDVDEHKWGWSGCFDRLCNHIE